MTRAASRFLVLVLPLIMAACDNNGVPVSNPFTAPSPIGGTGAFDGTAPFAGASLVPAAVPIVRLPRVRCPTDAPFASRFGVFIDPRGGTGVSLFQVGLEFSDASGLVSAAVFSQTDLTGMFGTTLVPSEGRRFPFSRRFGCELASAPLWLRVRLLLRDRHGALDRKLLEARLQ